MKPNEILHDLNTWDKEALINFERFQSGASTEKAPSEQTIQYVDSHVAALRDLGFLTHWDKQKSEYYITAVTSKITNDARVLKILAMLNSWNVEDLKSYELSRLGKVPTIWPSGEVAGLVELGQKELRPLGYVAVWDWERSCYDVERKP